MTDHIDEPEHVQDQPTSKNFNYYYSRRLEANLKHVQPGDELGIRRAKALSEEQAKQWEWLVVFNHLFSREDWEDDMEHYRNFDPENPQPLDLQNLPFDPAAQAMIGNYASAVRRVRAWACEND